MYGTPTYGKVDPTPPMVFVLPSFMGILLPGDAGCGLVVAGILSATSS